MTQQSKSEIISALFTLSTQRLTLCNRKINSSYRKRIEAQKEFDKPNLKFLKDIKTLKVSKGQRIETKRLAIDNGIHFSPKLITFS